MSEPHVIRLRGPWDFEAHEVALGQWRRRFGRPTGIGPGIAVWLHVRAEEALATLRLNEESIGQACAAQETLRIDVTGRLRERNVLEFVGPAQASFEVWLEIVAS